MAESPKNHQRWVFDSFGKPHDVLEWKTLPLKLLENNQVCVRWLAAPINPADLNWVEGTYGSRPELPGAVGIEGCGEVIASRASYLSEGDRVISLKRADSWASHSILPAQNLFRVPREIDAQQASMLKVNPATAWCLLNHFTTLQSGMTVVQNAGSSAVAQCVVQLARAAGIRTISFVRKPASIQHLTEIRADHVFLDDEEGHAAAAKFLTGESAMLAFNAIGGESATRLSQHVGDGGQVITYGAMARRPLTISNSMLIFRDIQFRGLWVTRWLAQEPPSRVQEVYELLAEKVRSGNLVQRIDAVFPLDQLMAALARLNAEDRSGKVLLAAP
ncbi:MAG: hypothetical protein EAZ42_10475 [Verrucomicrobia bacterium]|nr:MAG: hypothetical protein EAZ42_10475 [Verrucomicrobiota bacterium]